MAKRKTARAKENNFARSAASRSLDTGGCRVSSVDKSTRWKNEHMEGGMGAGGTYNGSATKEGPKSQEPWVALPAPVPRRVSGSKAIEEGVRIINGSIKDVISSGSKEHLLGAESNTRNFIAGTSRKGRSSKATEKAARRVVDENEGIKKGVSCFPMTKASKHFISRACVGSLRLPYTRSNETRIIASILVSLIIEQRSIETTFQDRASPTR